MRIAIDNDDICHECRYCIEKHYIYLEKHYIYLFTSLKCDLWYLMRDINQLTDCICTNSASLLFSMILHVMESALSSVYYATLPSYIWWFIVQPCAECKLHVDTFRMEYRHFADLYCILARHVSWFSWFIHARRNYVTHIICI